MKKIMLSLILATVLMSSCTSPASKVEDSKDNLIDAGTDLVEARKQYVADVEAYRIAKSERIAANDASIAEFKKRVADEKAAAKTDYLLRVGELERRNTDLKKRMDDYKEDSLIQWDSFKVEFGRDMDDLVKSLQDFTTKSK